MAALANAIEKGEPVDLNKLATLQAIDAVRADRAFLEEALIAEDNADEEFKATLERLSQ